MQIGSEKLLEVSLPINHELSARVSGTPKPGEEVFRARAAIELKQLFGNDLFFLRETRSSEQLFLRVGILNDRVEEFRERVAGLGFSVADLPSNSSRR